MVQLGALLIINVFSNHTSCSFILRARNNTIRRQSVLDAVLCVQPVFQPAG